MDERISAEHGLRVATSMDTPDPSTPTDHGHDHDDVDVESSVLDLESISSRLSLEDDVQSIGSTVEQSEEGLDGALGTESESPVDEQDGQHAAPGKHTGTYCPPPPRPVAKAALDDLNQMLLPDQVSIHHPNFLDGNKLLRKRLHMVKDFLVYYTHPSEQETGHKPRYPQPN